ncbi:MAG: glutamate synthase subunit alpha, partial [Deltaproteobacteria bacterium]|nr:glutamate synthase subunit alpha [Deltaproteobacteria bacterium]
MRDIAGLPQKQGLYDPRHEKDACGIGFVANIKGERSHSIVKQALSVLECLSHRGAQGCDPYTGDGAGILLQLPHRFLSEVVKSECDITLPPAGGYAVGMVFLPREKSQREQLERVFETILHDEKAKLLGWRTVPVRSDAIGPQARSTEPVVRQLFVTCPKPKAAKPGRGPADDELAFERKLYVIRKRVEHVVRESALAGREHFCVPSFSSRTIVYKGLLLPTQVGRYYADLADPRVESALGLVHSRFSTNTFPTWSLAHPYRYICHNGEINTVKGNVNWMRARQGRLQSDLFGPDLAKLFPIVADNQSDSACLDNALEFLHMGGRSLPHAMMMLIPEPYVSNPEMDLERRGFYEYH